MQKRFFSLSIFVFSFSIITYYGCSKLDTTDLGSDLLPVVDNVNTFDTVLAINTSQGIFDDSTRISRAEDHVLGMISNDPLFGTTVANVYMQLKPNFYPYYIGRAKDTLNGPGLGLDSVVLCLRYKGFWGDSTMPVQLQVREVMDDHFRDSVYLSKKISYTANLGAVLGSATVDVRRLADTVKYANRRDYGVHQIRIKLDATWATNLYNRDTSNNPSNNAFYSDSLYRRFYNGLAVVATGGNILTYVSLSDTSTKLEIHYRKRNNGKLDTTYSSLKLNSSFFGSSTNAPSGTANNIVRNRAGSSMMSPASGEIYLQTSPGSYANLNIPGLSALSNRIIHRAEIIIEQIPNGPLDNILIPPSFLYLDLKDTGIVDKWKPVYIDLNTFVPYDPDYRSGLPYFPGQIDYEYFGGFRREKRDLFGNAIKYYTFNITRHVQRIVTKRTPNYDFRLFSPYYLQYPQYSASYIDFTNSIAYGRVRVGSGSNPDYKMRLRIIYSKL